MELKTLSIKKKPKIKTCLKIFKYILRNNNKNSNFLRRTLGKKKILIFFLKAYKKIKKQKYFKLDKIQIKRKQKGNNRPLYTKIAGMLIKNGSKVKSFNIINNSLKYTSKKTKIPIKKILNIVYTKLKIFIEPKTIKRRKKNYIVPFPITKKRSFYLVSKWLLSATKKKFVGCTNMLSKELIQTATQKRSAALQYKKTTIRNVLKNKSNIHFRW